MDPKNNETILESPLIVTPIGSPRITPPWTMEEITSDKITKQQIASIIRRHSTAEFLEKHTLGGLNTRNIAKKPRKILVSCYADLFEKQFSSIFSTEQAKITVTPGSGGTMPSLWVIRAQEGQWCRVGLEPDDLEKKIYSSEIQESIKLSYRLKLGLDTSLSNLQVYPVFPSSVDGKSLADMVNNNGWFRISETKDIQKIPSTSLPGSSILTSLGEKKDHLDEMEIEDLKQLGHRLSELEESSLFNVLLDEKLSLEREKWEKEREEERKKWQEEREKERNEWEMTLDLERRTWQKEKEQETIKEKERIRLLLSSKLQHSMNKAIQDAISKI